jgi:hypothetical protein
MLKKFLFEESAAAVPDNVHPEAEPVTVPLELMLRVVDVPSNNVPVQLPEICASDAGVL